MVTGYVELDAIASTLLGNATCSFRRGERMLKCFRITERCHTKARSDLAIMELFDAFARVVGPISSLIERVIEQHRRESVAGQVGGDAARGLELCLPKPSDVANSLIAGRETCDFVNDVHLVKVGIDDASAVPSAPALKHFRFECRPQ